MRIRGVAAGVVLAAACIAARAPAEPSAAALREERVARFDAIAADWRALALEARLAGPPGAGGEPARVALGQPWELQVRAAADAYLLVLLLDAHGVLSLVSQDSLAPSPRSGAAWTKRAGQAAAPPFGETDLIVLATRTPLASLGAPRVLAPSDVVGFVGALQHTLAARDPAQVARARVRFQTLGRSGLRGTRIAADDASGGLEYSSEDIVAYYTSDRARVVGNVRLDLHVRFAQGSADLDAEAHKNLDVVGRALQDDRLADAAFRVGGHTDDVGPDAYNLALSKRRADAVRAYLSDEWGIAEARLVVVGYGESAPLELGTSESARAMNRRVDFEMTARGSAAH